MNKYKYKPEYLRDHEFILGLSHNIVKQACPLFRRALMLSSNYKSLVYLFPTSITVA